MSASTIAQKFDSHPDKVKLGVNQTVESVEAYFVEITKAYKAYVENLLSL